MERTLGRIWQGESDTFTFLLNIEEEADKKRKIVISVANIFDPMVFLACCHFQDSRLAAVKEGKGWTAMGGRTPKRWKTFAQELLARQLLTQQ
jgi:hypothetical protein